MTKTKDEYGIRHTKKPDCRSRGGVGMPEFYCKEMYENPRSMTPLKKLLLTLEGLIIPPLLALFRCRTRVPKGVIKLYSKRCAFN